MEANPSQLHRFNSSLHYLGENQGGVGVIFQTVVVENKGWKGNGSLFIVLSPFSRTSNHRHL
ncbi:hypothetical protein E2C01_099035 [Portunus trituberculatus]|uniref:Uncharacterized protein n=1 Tax=Portunus trituberculatus TaxID=210409 RepID=A0A5B7K9X6_PORTR|nr:hypothetical protein [Portunus trituberculatus]